MGALALVALGVIIWVAARGSKRSNARRVTTSQPVPRTPRSRAQRDADVVGGWMLGHQIAKGHTGFPGDPLPGGHLGAPQDLAFWGGVFDEDDGAGDD